MTAESESAKDSTLAHLEGSAEADIALALEDISRCIKISTSEHWQRYHVSSKKKLNILNSLSDVTPLYSISCFACIV